MQGCHQAMETGFLQCVLRFQPASQPTTSDQSCPLSPPQPLHPLSFPTRHLNPCFTGEKGQFYTGPSSSAHSLPSLQSPSPLLPESSHFSFSCTIIGLSRVFHVSTKTQTLLLSLTGEKVFLSPTTARELFCTFHSNSWNTISILFLGF